MSTKAKTTAAKKTAAKKTTPTAEANLAVLVIVPEGTKYKSMNLGYGWRGALPESAAKSLEKLNHVRIEGIA